MRPQHRLDHRREHSDSKQAGDALPGVQQMTYFTAMKVALCFDWFKYIKRDSVSGNGFQIAAYGLKLVFLYLTAFLCRLLIAVAFPVSALVVMRNHRTNSRYQRELEQRLNGDL